MNPDQTKPTNQPSLGQNPSPENHEATDQSVISILSKLLASILFKKDPLPSAKDISTVPDASLRLFLIGLGFFAFNLVIVGLLIYAVLTSEHMSDAAGAGFVVMYFIYTIPAMWVCLLASMFMSIVEIVWLRRHNQPRGSRRTVTFGLSLLLLIATGFSVAALFLYPY